MLKNDFYHNSGELIENEGGAFLQSIRFNVGHPIFGGHFPAMKVVPGVTMVQIVKETLEGILEQPLRLVKSSMIKFMAVIQPDLDPEMDLNLTLTHNEGAYQVVANLKTSEKIFFKFKGEFHAVS